MVSRFSLSLSFGLAVGILLIQAIMRAGTRESNDIVKRKISRELDISKDNIELAAPDGEPLQLADIQVVWKLEGDVLAAIKGSCQCG